MNEGPGPVELPLYTTLTGTGQLALTVKAS